MFFLQKIKVRKMLFLEIKIYFFIIWYKGRTNSTNQKENRALFARFCIKNVFPPYSEAVSTLPR